MNILKIAIISLIFLRFNTVFGQQKTILNNEKLAKYVQQFNALDSEEAVINYVPNKESFKWLSENIPLFECPILSFKRYIITVGGPCEST